MLSSPEQTLLREAQPLSGAENDYDSLLDQVGDASVVLLGEASHSTHECYRERARITRWLIEERREPRFVLDLVSSDAAQALVEPHLERAIGVIYRHETERQSHYFLAHIPGQFDVVVHIDETRAVEPLERTAGWEAGEAPETYPSGF
jgi:erythromycin esterase-like protein